MSLDSIVAALDEEIFRLQETRNLLVRIPVDVGGESDTKRENLGNKRRKKVNASVRAKISAAQKARWAKNKKGMKKA